MENTYNTLNELLQDQINQTNRNLQFVTDARTLEQINNGDEVYSRTYQLKLNKDLFVIDGSINAPGFNYEFYVIRLTTIKGFTLCGDVLYNGDGNAGNAVYTYDASDCLFEDIYITKFERGASLNIGTPARAAYYNTFRKVQIQYVRQALLINTGTAVSGFENCVFVSRSETIANYKHLIECYNNSTFTNCSFEGATTPVDEAIYAPIGKLTIQGGRDESNALVKFSGRGITGGVNITLPNGPVGNLPSRFGSIIDIEDAPLKVDMDIDQNVIGQNISFGQGSCQEIQMLKNPDFKFGLTDWDFDGDGTENNGFYNIINNRENVMGSDFSIRLEKTNSNQYTIQQKFNINSPQTYYCIWVKEIDDAITRTQIGALFPKDDSSDPSFKEFVTVYIMGDWKFKVAKVSHYYKNTPNTNPTIYLGLKPNSPVGSSVIYSNLKVFVGGFPTFTGSYNNKVVKDFVLSQKPSQSFLNLGDRIYYDGSSNLYPLEGDTPISSICTFYDEKTVTQNANILDQNLTLNSTTSLKVNDFINVNLDNGFTQFIKISNIVGNVVTLSNPLDDNVSNGNTVKVSRLEDQYLSKDTEPIPDGVMAYKGDWNPLTNTPTLSDDDINKKGDVYRVSETADFNLGLGLSSDIFNTAIISNVTGTSAAFISGGLTASSNGSGLQLRPRFKWDNLISEGKSYKLEILDISINSGVNPDYSFYDGSNYIDDNIQLTEKVIDFVAGSTPIFLSINGSQVFDIDVLVTLKEVSDNALNTYNKGDIISNDGDNYFLLSNNNGNPTNNLPKLVTDIVVSPIYDIDWSFDTWDLFINAATEFTESNLPLSGTNTKVITLYVQGEFPLTFPTGWSDNIIGEYSGEFRNQIVVEFIKDGDYAVEINQPD